MAITRRKLQRQVELTVDVYGDGKFLLTYLPSRLSKPMLQKVQALADAEEWEIKADSNTIFLHELIDTWTIGEEDPDDPEKVLIVDGKEVIQEVNEENIAALGFMIMRDIAKAINTHYSEFMAQGEETGASSDAPSSGVSPTKSAGTLLSSPATELEQPSLGN